jgi:shikimate kinase
MSSADKIILVGFMGTGKSTVGRLVAERLGWRFTDTDQVIEGRAGKPVREIFTQDGEAAFRALEADVCEELRMWRNTVIATGGGILLAPENRTRLFRAGLVICLSAPAEQIARRLAHDSDRPLLAGADRLQKMQELLGARQAVYALAPYRIETSGMTPFAVSERVIQLWRSTR